MHDLQCAEVRDSAAEFALDILDPNERSAVAAHLLRCPDCRSEVDSMHLTADRLLDLVPGTEPPLGFDRRVLERLGITGHRRRVWQWGLSAAAAVLIVLGVSLGVVESGTSHPSPQLASAVLVQSGRHVGSIEVYRTTKTPWVTMSVRGVNGAHGSVACELVDRSGQLMTVGRFDLVNGSGSWAAPDKWSTSNLAGARLVDTTGQVVATATF